LAGEDVLEQQLQQAYQKLRAGFKLGARQVIRVLMQTDPHNPDAWYLLSRAAFTSGEARRALRIALTLDEGGYWVHQAVTRFQQKYPLETDVIEEGEEVEAPSAPTQAEALPWAGSPEQADETAWAELMSHIGAPKPPPTPAETPLEPSPPAEAPPPPARLPVSQAPVEAVEEAKPTPQPKIRRLSDARSAGPEAARSLVRPDMDVEKEKEAPTAQPKREFPKAIPGIKLSRDQKKMLRQAEGALRLVSSKGTAPLGRKKAEVERAIAEGVALYREALSSGAGAANHWLDMATMLEHLADRVSVIAEERGPRGYTPPGLIPIAKVLEPALHRPPDWQAVADLCYEIISACEQVPRLAEGDRRRERKLRQQAEVKKQEMKAALAELQALL
jgi:hypothetical protein